jgi:hypothetical protein
MLSQLNRLRPKLPGRLLSMDSRLRGNDVGVYKYLALHAAITFATYSASSRRVIK